MSDNSRSNMSNMSNNNNNTLMFDWKLFFEEHLQKLSENGILCNLSAIIFSKSIFITLIVLMVIGFIYWLFYIPCNWKKNIDDVSYDICLKPTQKRKGKHRKEAINRIRKLRKTGDLPPPYPNGWYAILESNEIKRGEVTSTSCLGEQFAVYRTLEGEVRVLDAHCPHLGANMGVGGRVVGDSIECPFHLWRFSGVDGKCVNVPYSKCVPQISKARTWKTVEANGFIFIWYSAESDVEPWEIPVIKEIENGEFVSLGRNEFYVNCHIQEIPENGADLAHFAAIHEAALLAGSDDPNRSMLSKAGTHHWEAVWSNSESKRKHIASIDLKHAIEFTPKIRVFNVDVLAEQIGPAYVQLHMKFPRFRVEVLQTVVPVEPLIQKVIHVFYARRIVAPIMKFLVLGESIMFERDMNVWNHKMFKNRPQLVKEDSSIKIFRNWYSQFYSENSKSFSEAKDDLNW